MTLFDLSAAFPALLHSLLSDTPPSWLLGCYFLLVFLILCCPFLLSCFQPLFSLCSPSLLMLLRVLPCILSLRLSLGDFTPFQSPVRHLPWMMAPSLCLQLRPLRDNYQWCRSTWKPQFNMSQFSSSLLLLYCLKTKQNKSLYQVNGRKYHTILYFYCFIGDSKIFFTLY